MAKPSLFVAFHGLLYLIFYCKNGLHLFKKARLVTKWLNEILLEDIAHHSEKSCRRSIPGQRIFRIVCVSFLHGVAEQLIIPGFQKPNRDGLLVVPGRSCA